MLNNSKEIAHCTANLEDDIVNKSRIEYYYKNCDDRCTLKINRSLE